jgi:hypothetical protein
LLSRPDDASFRDASASSLSVALQNRLDAVGAPAVPTIFASSKKVAANDAAAADPNVEKSTPGQSVEAGSGWLKGLKYSYKHGLEPVT